MKKKKFSIILTAILVFVMAFAFVGCQNSDGKQPEKPGGKGRVTLSPAMNIDISDGAVKIPHEEDGNVTEITWESDRAIVASVDSEGKVFPVAKGIAIITATMGTSTSECVVTVTNTYANYIAISTAEEFNAIGSGTAYTKSGTKYCLAADIDFGGEVIQPIGGWGDGEGKVFNATFDGRGYALSNFRIENPASCLSEGNYFGVSLFPQVHGAIRNLNLIGVNFTGFGFTAGLVGHCESGTVENCYVQGEISATGGWLVPAGGICGIMGGSAKVSNNFINLKINVGFVFCGFNFGEGTYCNAVSSAIGDDGALMFQIDDTGKPGPEGEGENSALTTFKDSKRLEDSELDVLANYSFGPNPRWAVKEGYMAFLPRPDGLVPSWAEIAI